MEHPKLYKGIEYVQLKELPEDQQQKITQSLSRELFIKILIDGQLHQDCILYKDYKQWFENVYSAPATREQPAPEPSPATVTSLNVSIAKS
ncbi:MAG: hypothetical protein DIU61_000205 [Bacteroidota bacterium]|jgi:hypothetical protein|nr:MAG: hypothetical protein DIU61_03400 [Bacteroidota bacterium]